MYNEIYQYIPFNNITPSTYTFNHPAIFGVSINEDDFMKNKEYSFFIKQGDNIQTIQIGRTGMYEIDKPIIGSVIFPENTPRSVKLDVIYQL